MSVNEQMHVQSHDEVDQDVFRRVVSHFASGVTIITTGEEGTMYGTTASAVSSLSMDPPMMLVCLNRSSSTHDAIKRSGVFAINILAEGQGELAYRFASKRIVDRFEGVDHVVAANGVPVLDGTLASIVCETEELAKGGTHTVFLARVVAAASGDGEPLTYFRGKFGRLERVQEHEVYLRVRQWVLSRPLAPGQPIDEAELALQLDADGAYVRNALIRLMTESLVGRDDDGPSHPRADHAPSSSTASSTGAPRSSWACSTSTCTRPRRRTCRSFANWPGASLLRATAPSAPSSSSWSPPTSSTSGSCRSRAHCRC